MTLDSKAPPLPPAVKRLARWFWLPAGVAVFGASSLLCSQVPQLLASLKGWSVAVIPSFFFVPQFAAILAVWLGNRRIKARYLAADGRLCTNCTYSLKGLPDTGQCPECAAPYDIIADAPSWRRALTPPLSRKAATIGGSGLG